MPESRAAWLSESQRSTYDRDGYLVQPDLIDAKTIAAATDACDALETAVEADLRQAAGGRIAIAEADAIVFVPHVAARSEVLGSIARDPRIVGPVIDLLGPDVDLYWDQIVYKKPQKPRRFPWHQDNGYTFVEPQQYVTVWLALNDATLDNGARGWHRPPSTRHARPRLRRPAGLPVL